MTINSGNMIDIGKVSYDITEFMSIVSQYKDFDDVCLAMGCSRRDLQIGLASVVPGWHNKRGETLEDKLYDCS